MNKPIEFFEECEDCDLRLRGECEGRRVNTKGKGGEE